eukprot:1948837-Pleurochrysis_carterae.AAC.4
MSIAKGRGGSRFCAKRRARSLRSAMSSELSKRWRMTFLKSNSASKDKSMAIKRSLLSPY